MSPVERNQLDIFARLSAHAYFADVGVFLLRPREQDGFVQIQSRIDQLIGCQMRKAGKGGATVTVLMPLADAVDPNVGGPLLSFTYTVRIQELPVLNMGPNGTQKSAEEIALEVLGLLHHFTTGAGNVLVAAPEAYTPTDAFDPKLTIDVRLQQRGGLVPATRCGLPLISPDSGAVPQTVTLTTATSGAAIWYTIDGSYPSSANPTATLYTAPIEIAAACTLRVAAQKTGLQQSNIAQAIFT